MFVLKHYITFFNFNVLKHDTLKLSTFIKLPLPPSYYTMFHWLNPNLSQHSQPQIAKNIVSTRLTINTLFIATEFQRHSILLINPVSLVSLIFSSDDYFKSLLFLSIVCSLSLLIFS